MNMVNVITTALFSLLFLAQAAVADEALDIDQSSTLDFQGFHTTKKEAIKLYDSQYGGILGGGNKEAKNTASTIKENAGETDKHYEIRERYALSRSEYTGYNPVTVVQALHLQMQGFCPSGWRKLEERSEPASDDTLYMYYVFECLETE